MYVLQWCALCALVAGSAAAAGAVDVEGTVRRVQALLRANSLLPRLSRQEILELLDDIRAEDAGSTKAQTTPYSSIHNEVSPERGQAAEVAQSGLVFDSTTEKDEASMLVVLPYTPRDGFSLQELYTKPPKVEKVPLVDGAARPAKGLSGDRLQATLTHNAKLAETRKREDFPEELQAFLEAHGLEGSPGRDHFLLPLEGFKPLPPAKIVDGNIQLPENILLTYDLISASDAKSGAAPANDFLYEPLGPQEAPFELDTSSSETKETVYPLQMPSALTKGNLLPLNLEPLDYDAIKVIPLKKGISPVEDSKVPSESEQSKRQANGTEKATTATTAAETAEDGESAEGSAAAAAGDSAAAAAGDSAAAAAGDSAAAAAAAGDSAESSKDSAASAASESGASLADLESSFGGALPAEPGDAELPPPRKNGFYWMVDWNSFLEVGDGDSKVNIRFEPKLGDPQMFLPVSVP